MEIGVCGNYRNNLRDLCTDVHNIFSDARIVVQIHSYSSAALLLSRREKLAQLDLIIWNLRVLPGDFGDIIQNLRKWHFGGDCLFIADEPVRMQRAAGVYPANVLVRSDDLPDILRSRLKEAYTRWLARESRRHLMIPFQGHIRRFPISEVYCVRADNNMVVIYSGKTMFGFESASWKTISQQLLSCGFFSCSEDCVLNSRMVTAVLPGKKEHRVILSNGKYFSVKPDTANVLMSQQSFAENGIAQQKNLFFDFYNEKTAIYNRKLT